MRIILLLYFLFILSVLLTACRHNVSTSGLPVNAKDGAELVLIPAGNFLMGTRTEELTNWKKTHPAEEHNWFSDEMPQNTVYLDNYYIYKTDVTVAQYRKFCKETKAEMPDAPPWGWHDNQPIINVSAGDATVYAQWAGATVPTEAEWEKAARGTDGRSYPWGSTWDAGKCLNSVCVKRPLQPSPVGSFPAGASPYGVLDMVGNVLEWCSDMYDPNYYTTVATQKTNGPRAQGSRVLRGGYWGINEPMLFRTAVRDHASPTTKSISIGFRCVVHTSKQ